MCTARLDFVCTSPFVCYHPPLPRFLSIGSMTASIIATPAKADQNRSFPLPMGAGHVRSQRSRLSGYRRRKQATTTAPCSDYSSWAASASSDSCIFTLHTCEGGARGGGSAHLLVLSSRHNGTRMMAAFGATPLVYHYCRTGKDFGRRGRDSIV